MFFFLNKIIQNTQRRQATERQCSMQNAGATQTEKVTITFFSGSLDLSYKDGRRIGRTHKLTEYKFWKRFAYIFRHRRIANSMFHPFSILCADLDANQHVTMDLSIERDASNTRTLSLPILQLVEVVSSRFTVYSSTYALETTEKIERHRHHHRHQHEIYYGKYETFTIHVELVSVKR